MKQKLLLSALFISLFSFGQIINFPDANLKAKLLSPNTASYYNPNYISVNLDSNGDGEIEVSETLLAERINIANSNISSLEGLEYFPNLKYVNTIGNPIATQSLMALTQIKEVLLGLNGWTIIDSSVIPQNITFLYVNFGTTITQFCPNSLTQLKKISLQNYPFTDLNLCNTAVKALFIYTAPNLTTINLKNNHLTPQFVTSVTYRNTIVSAPPSIPPPAIWITCDTSNPLTIYVDAGEISEIDAGFISNPHQLVTNAPPCDTSVTCANALSTPTFDYFTTHPNPVETTMTLSNTFNKTIDQLTVFALDGKVVYQQRNVAQEIDMSSLFSGLYLLKIECNDGSVYTKKILKK
ncbi:T9SS type A sorting domain-containing protein [Flavobacterium stagni]|uniref:T9SS type A sorting domain-containing protein n=1 Tax=Flavobacterium stagni TaxID=2506421 RepID=A0A4Q1K8Q6_9FLAO|nr:T9SS type A sorting domain-containing protein [Flavobacterium stagni]RXR22816.1 T9SS type A sorting domain-containing protein [Flavobacterium stagni]